jgi:hypothetical protein
MSANLSTDIAVSGLRRFEQTTRVGLVDERLARRHYGRQDDNRSKHFHASTTYFSTCVLQMFLSHTHRKLKDKLRSAPYDGAVMQTDALMRSAEIYALPAILKSKLIDVASHRPRLMTSASSNLNKTKLQPSSDNRPLQSALHLRGFRWHFASYDAFSSR